MLKRSAAQLFLSLQEAAAQRCAQSAPAVALGTCAAQARHSSSRPPSAPEADPFTVQLQRRTEDELRALLEKREAQAAPAAEHVEDEEADEEVQPCFGLCMYLYLQALMSPDCRRPAQSGRHCAPQHACEVGTCIG
jgi:hypothetical protein